MNSATNLAVRVLVDLARPAELDDAAVLHHRDVAGQRQRLDLVVGDVDRGDAELALQPLELVAQRLAQLGVEVGQRLVEQQQRRLDDERPGQREALLLAAGELGGLTLGVRGELHRLQHPVHALPISFLPGRSAALAHLQREGDVVEDRHVRPDGVGLEHHAEAALVGRDVDRADAVTLAENSGRSPTVMRPESGLLQAGDRAQRRGLAAAGRAEQGEHLALRTSKLTSLTANTRPLSAGLGAASAGSP